MYPRFHFCWSHNHLKHEAAMYRHNYDFLTFPRAGKMSNICSLVNKANQKVTGQSSSSRKRIEQRDRTAEAWFPVRVTDKPAEEEEVPLKRKRIGALDMSKQVQTQVVVRYKDALPVDEGLFQVPKVWSRFDYFGPQASLYLGDYELKAIRDLGPVGRSHAVTEGVVCAMRALEVVVFLNNSSTEEAVRSKALARERGETAKKMAKLEAKVIVLKEGTSDKDMMIAFLKEKAESTSRYHNELSEVRAMFTTEKKVLDDALCDASQPGEDETEDTAVRARPALVYRLEELERNLVGLRVTVLIMP